MASIKKLPSGRFQATVYIGRDANGKQDKRKRTFDSEREAKSWARVLEQEIEERKYTNMDNTRATVWFDNWLELSKNSISPSTYVSYKMYVEVHFKPAFGSFKLGQIKEMHIKKYINEKLNSLSPTTVRKHILVLRKMLYDALKSKSPCIDIEVPKPGKYKPYPLTEKEFLKIHNTVKGTRDEPIILLAAWCGFRRGEIFALKWDDINWDLGTIRIDESRALSEDGYVDKKPKSDNGLRTVVVPDALIQILKNFRVEQTKSKYHQKAIKKATTTLLKKYGGKTIDDIPKEQKDAYLNELREIHSRIFLIRPDSYSSYFRELLDTKKLAPIRFHDLRHYHATWLYKQGIPDQYAAQRLGHDIQVLKGIYQHLDVDRKTETDNLIRAGFGEHGEQKGNKTFQTN